jgi:hypothetical protein
VEAPLCDDSLRRVEQLLAPLARLHSHRHYVTPL